MPTNVDPNKDLAKVLSGGSEPAAEELNLKRAFEISSEKVDAENRTVELSFSSSEPYTRFWGVEVLDHGDGCDLARLNNAGALLWMHDWADQIGVVESARIEGDKGIAVVRFSKSPRGEEMWQDVQDGIKRNVSVGYFVQEMILERENDESPDEYRVTKWQPYEISLVSVPADETVGVGREAEALAVRMLAGNEPRIPVGGTVSESRSAGHEEGENLDGEGTDNDNLNQRIEMPEKNELTAEQERKRVSEIHKMSRLDAYKGFCSSEKVDEWINSGASVESVTRTILDAHAAEAPKAEVEIPEKEAKEFSIVRAINQIAQNGKLEGVEKDISDATAKHVKRDAQGFFVPNAIASRALTANTGSSGGYTVGTEVQAASMVELLRNKTKVAGLGARMLSGLVGDVAIPKATGGATAYWLGETETGSDSQQTFGQLALTPHRLVGTTPFSKQLLAQSSIDVEAFVREDIASVLAIAKDLACINGSGADGQPLGIMNTTGINAGVTFGGAPTWADVVQFETDIFSDNAESENMSFLTTPSVQGKWKTTERATNTGLFLLDDDGRANGYNFEVTNQVPDNKVIFGNFADLIMADWDGIDVVVDPYSLAKSGQIQLTITLMCDVAVRHPVSFSVSTDAGNQA